MSYVDEVIEQVIRQNPAEPEFHQAVKEVLESLRVVVEANEEGCLLYTSGGDYEKRVYTYLADVFGIFRNSRNFRAERPGGGKPSGNL